MKKVERESEVHRIAKKMRDVADKQNGRYYFEEADELLDRAVKLLEESKGLTHCDTVEAMKYRDNVRSNRTVVKYIGSWKDGKKNGQGSLIYRNGDSYDGEWKDDFMNGHGKCIWTNGDTYEGEWKDGEYHGEGTLTFADGGSYSGRWKDGKMNGEGTVTFASGDSYSGGWKDGKYHGQGTVTFANGSSFTREWVNGELQKAVNQR